MTRTLVLDKRYKGVGRIKRATGTNDPVEFQRIAECFKTLEMIAGGVLAMEMGAVAHDIASSIHPHPTLSEMVSEAAGMMPGA